MRRSYPLIALLLLSCSDEIKPACPEVECIAPIKQEHIEENRNCEDGQLRGTPYSYQVCLFIKNYGVLFPHLRHTADISGEKVLRAMEDRKYQK
jgi:hypothetical protein